MRSSREMYRGRSRIGVGVASAVLVVGLSPGAYADPARMPASGHAHIAFVIDVARIKESSSLVDSTAHPGLVYTANDSGDGPFVYVLDDSGELVGTTTLDGVKPVDVEAMAGGADGSLIVADIGDNSARRSNVQVYRIPQPTTGDHTVTPDKVTLTYPGGPRNAESVIYDSDSDQLIVVSKERAGHIYMSPTNVFAMSSATLTEVTVAPSYATDATLLPGGDAAIIRTYRRAYVYDYPSWRSVTWFLLPHQQQGESVTGIPGQAIWVGSEGVQSPVWWVPLPPAARALVHAGRGGAAHPPRSPHPVAAPIGAIAAMSAATSGSAMNVVRAVARISRGGGTLVVVLAAVVLLSRGRRPRAPS